jgi:hypothetical protein
MTAVGRRHTAFSLLIDAEPDGFFIDPSEQTAWYGFEAAVERLGAFRARLAGRGRPAAFSWFVRADPQVEHTYGDAGWAFQRYGAALAGLEAAGDEVGLHVHGYRWVSEADDWLVDHGNAAWMEHAARLGAAAFEAAMGRRCRCFRFGDRWFSAAAFDVLRELGIACDMTVEPEMAAAPTFHADHAATGEIPAAAGAPREPYYPLPGDPLRPGGEPSGLVEVPLSVSPVPERWAPVQRAPWAILRRLPKYPMRLRTLRLDQEPRWFRAQVADLARRSAHVRCVARSDGFIDPAMAPRIEANLAWLAGRRELRFVTALAAVEGGRATGG